MDTIFSEIEVRVLGSLVEKEITTPEYYPLTLNSLVTACNQKTNRDPVVSYDEDEVLETLESLREKDLVIVCEGSRARKYDNYFADRFHLSAAEAAVMCVLMLRGPQTAGEIRGRTDRLYTLTEVSEVEAVLEGLASREDGPLVKRLPRQPGRKEHRYAHLLSGDVAVDSPESIEQPTESLRDRVERLEAQVEDLRREFVEFKKQFE